MESNKYDDFVKELSHMKVDFNEDKETGRIKVETRLGLGFYHPKSGWFEFGSRRGYITDVYYFCTVLRDEFGLMPTEQQVERLHQGLLRTYKVGKLGA